MWSDASGALGIEGHLDGPENFAERIPEKHMGKDIMFKEALAVLTCVEKWKHPFHRRLVVFHVDNQALAAAINKGGCRQRPTQALIRRLYTLAVHHSFSLRSEWLYSEANKRVDVLSRFKTCIPGPATTSDSYVGDFDPDFTANDPNPWTTDEQDDDWVLFQHWPQWSSL